MHDREWLCNSCNELQDGDAKQCAHKNCQHSQFCSDCILNCVDCGESYCEDDVLMHIDNGGFLIERCIECAQKLQEAVRKEAA